MIFMIRFFNLGTRETEKHIIESHTVVQALRSAMALTMGKDTRDMVIIQEDE